jgi:mono/diheme cytochrome c family protein
MNRYTLIAVAALVVLIVALPVYAWREPVRLQESRIQVQQDFLADGAVVYVDRCIACHGPGGEGIGSAPPLNNPALAHADHAVLYDTVARPPHGTAMSAWHVGGDGSLHTYEVESLVTLIKTSGWSNVEQVLAANNIRWETAVEEPDLMAVEISEEMGPHECRACHEQPEIHAARFGQDCSRCHGLETWKPAQLLRHVFLLDHGGQGLVACQTCHTDSYAANTCYGCHDHDPAEMQAVHEAEEIDDYDDCSTCHPTGVADEAARMGYGVSGREYRRALDQVGQTGEPEPAHLSFEGSGLTDTPAQGQ